MEPRGDIESPSFLDPKSLGFMCGLEIHQQLNTGKLHSRMPSQLYDLRFQRFLKTGNVPIGSCAHLKEKEGK